MLPSLLEMLSSLLEMLLLLAHLGLSLLLLLPLELLLLGLQLCLQTSSLFLLVVEEALELQYLVLEFPEGQFAFVVVGPVGGDGVEEGGAGLGRGGVTWERRLVSRWKRHSPN